jgi:type I restriction enzyme S subunit
MTSEVILPSTASGVLTSLRRWKRYPAYRDSGVDWLGEIPKHWRVKPLKHAVAMNEDALAETTSPEYELSYVDIANVDPLGNILGAIGLRFADAPSRARRLVKHGDTIISTVRTYLKAIAYVSHPADNLIVSTGFAVLRPGVGLHPSFLFRLVQAEQFIQAVVAHSEGVGYPAINPSRLATLPVWLPPLPEQRAVADFLGRETSKIDALVAKRERLIELLQEKRAAVIAHAVTKGLDPNVPTKDSGIQWLGEIPAHWEVKRLMYLTQPGRPIMYGIVLPGPNVDEGVLIVKGGDVAPGRLRPDLLQKTTAEIEAGYVRSRLRPGDIVYAIRGSIGAAERIPPELDGANLTQDAARVAPGAAAQGEWLLWALKSRSTFGQLEAGALGATIRGINIRDLKRAFLPVPAGNEQRSIAEYLGRETSQVGTLIARVLQHIDKLREFRTALISAAVTGKIDVRSEV